MSGPFGSQHWAYSPDFYPYEIGNSVRFDSNSYISRTPSSAGNRKTYTISTWVKFCKFPGAVGQAIWAAGASGARVMAYLYNEKLNINRYDGSYVWSLQTEQVFRDPSAWYHIVIAIDTTDSTASDRVKIYVNGDRVTTFATTPTYPALNLDTYTNNTVPHTHGASPYNSLYLNGYISEINFIDGQALDASYFGETKTDTWIPKKYAGSYGTNGYYLDFATRATNPIDASGNGNNFSSTNVVSTDWMLDSPTNNFATFNSVFGIGRQDQITYSQGNLQAVSAATGGNDTTSVSTISPSGKVYAEFVLQSDANGVYIGVMEPDTSLTNSGVDTSNTAGVFIVRGDNGHKAANDGGSAFFGSAFSNGDIIQVAVDTDAKKLWFGRNGTWGSAGNPSTGANAALGASDGVTSDLLFICGDHYSSKTPTIVANFGQDSSFAGNKTAQGYTDANGIGDFYYSVPTGFLALCSANLPDPAATINPALNNSPQDHFNTVTYTGNSSTDRDITGVGFQPDWVWIKKRNVAKSHNLFDVLRGAGKMLETNSTIGDFTDTDRLNGFISDGFNVGNDNAVNNSGDTYVAWNWKAGGSGVSNSDGTISSTVSANTDAGVSIVTYNGSSAGTVGHGLGSAPELVIQKVRNQSGDYWWTGTTVIDGSMDFLKLNDTDAKANSSYAVPTSSVFSNVTFTGATSNVAYCFHSVEGFSKIGVFTGNGNADGPFVYCGFKPAWVLLKNSNDAEWWTLVDNKRLGYNETNSILSPNANGAEYSSSGGGLDLVSNGFKPRGTSNNFNGSSDNILYMAFAEMPFKYANAR